MENQYSVEDIFEGVLLETTIDDGISRPRVRPLEYFEKDIRVEFPRYLREENPIGTRFRADVKVCQKTNENGPVGKLYLRADKNTIEKIEEHQPIRNLFPNKLNTASDRSYEYIEKEFKIGFNLTPFKELRKNAYDNSIKLPSEIELNNQIKTNRLDLIRTYALTRAKGKCECCQNDSPFLKRNGCPYLEVNHLIELSKSVNDSPLNVAAICPNCQARITDGIDGKELNKQLIIKIVSLESHFEKL
jgi:5-methylcytosine-specific restriction endonuclease McrA